MFFFFAYSVPSQNIEYLLFADESPFANETKNKYENRITMYHLLNCFPS